MSHLITQPPPAKTRFEVVVYTRQRSEVFPLTDSSVIGIGRNAECTIRIDDPSVSRQHARLCANGELVEVEDLGSSNGTMLIRRPSSSNGEEDTSSGIHHRLISHQRIPLRVGDTLRIGPAVITLQAKARSSLSQLKSTRTTSGPAVLLDPAMKSAYELITRASASDISILILGETGVGKEVMAEAVHRRSLRSKGPFLLLNCAALPETLLESELFGHEKGAFTGAHAAKAGLLESTDGGTVFLDEIGELALGTQAKLLRVLEQRSVIRIGATKPRRINVRFVTATNRDLAREVRAARFRGDLYYRISGLVVRIPPLRRRPLEIEPLARYFLSEFCEHMGQPQPNLTPEALSALQSYDWPGNVRELRNVMERAALLSKQEPITREHVLLEPPISSGEQEDASEYDEPTQVISLPKPAATPPPEDERERVIRALEACGGNQTRAAKMLGISRRTLINRLEQWKLPRPKKA